jgi:hypothetical protein
MKNQENWVHILAREKDFLFSTTSRLSDPNKSFIACRTAAKTCNWPLCSIYCQGYQQVELCINSPSILNGIHGDNNLNLQKCRDLSQAYVKRIGRHYFPHFSETWQVMPKKCYLDIGVKIAEVGRYFSRHSDERHSRGTVFRFSAWEKIYFSNASGLSLRTTQPPIQLWQWSFSTGSMKLIFRLNLQHSFLPRLYAVVVNKADGKPLSSIFV